MQKLPFEIVKKQFSIRISFNEKISPARRVFRRERAPHWSAATTGCRGWCRCQRWRSPRGRWCVGRRGARGRPPPCWGSAGRWWRSAPPWGRRAPAPPPLLQPPWICTPPPTPSPANDNARRQKPDLLRTAMIIKLKNIQKASGRAPDADFF